MPTVPKLEAFSNEILSALVRITVDHFDTYKCAQDSLILSLIPEHVTNGKLPAKMAPLIAEQAEELLGFRLQNRDYVINKYDHLILSQRLATALPDVAELSRRGNFDEARRIFIEAMNVTPKGCNDLFNFFKADPTECIEYLNQREQERFLTTIPVLDNQYRAYIHRGELGIIQGAGTGIGKSAMFVFLARAAIVQGYKTLICTMELSELQYKSRLASCISGILVTPTSDAAAIGEKVRRMMKTDDRIKVTKFPAGATTVAPLAPTHNY